MAKALRPVTGRVVAITGGARGIGRATAAALITQGARVAIGDIEADLAERSARELGGGTVGLALDVTDRRSFATFLDEVEEQLGPINVVINNAGIMPIGPFVEETDATAERMVDINLHGVILGSKLALERFIPRGRGHLVNIASSAGKAGFPGGATYCATKHGVVGLSEAILAEVRGTDIEVSVVMPVVVNTELGSGLAPTRGFKPIEPEEVANAIVEALQSGRFDVYIPKAIGLLFRFQNLIPRRGMEWVARTLKGDQVLAHPDHVARAAYEARMAQLVSASPAPGATEVPAPTEAAAAQAGAAAAESVTGDRSNGDVTPAVEPAEEREPEKV